MGYLSFFNDWSKIGHQISCSHLYLSMKFPVLIQAFVALFYLIICLSDILDNVFITFFTENVSTIYEKQACRLWKVSCDISSCFHVRQILASRIEVSELAWMLDPWTWVSFLSKSVFSGREKRRMGMENRCVPLSRRLIVLISDSTQLEDHIIIYKKWKANKKPKYDYLFLS